MNGAGVLTNALSRVSLFSDSVDLSIGAPQSLQNDGKIKIKTPVTHCKGLCLMLSSIVTPCQTSITFLPDEALYNFHPSFSCPCLDHDVCSSLEHPFSNQNLCNSKTLRKTLFLYEVLRMYQAYLRPFSRVVGYKNVTFKKSEGHRIDLIKFSLYREVPISVLFYYQYFLLL